MRDALKVQGAPEDIFQCIEKPSIPLAEYLMSICDLTIATGGPAMVRAAYSSGKPAYGLGAGNATMIIDETADIDPAIYEFINKHNEDSMRAASQYLSDHPEYRSDLVDA
jgi:acyl-CoA reductase-like NAD-dependent aldehyde dehydrogenase